MTETTTAPHEKNLKPFQKTDAHQQATLINLQEWPMTTDTYKATEVREMENKIKLKLFEIRTHSISKHTRLNKSKLLEQHNMKLQ
jgi:hypothetical protein